ncbi:hypothetical protein CIB48_g9383 [Xylaria polymorpha]|nr:hypothetical protein CIB48_g9383 [Xylaria polymorpha]
MVTGDNPFIRFKNYIDNRVHRGLELLFGSPQSTATSSKDPCSSHGESINAPTNNTTTHLQQQQQQQQRLQSSSLLSSAGLKMTKNASTTASVAEEPEQHTTTTMDEVHTWSIHSPYSPLNLQHLPQPTPRGAPRSSEAHFTFRDAFEDLLVAGSGQPLPSMRELAWKKRREGFPFWEDRGTHVTQWVGRLAAGGLWDALFRMEPGATGGIGKRGEGRGSDSCISAKAGRLEGTSTPDAPNGAPERDPKNERRVVQWVEGSGSKKPSHPEITTTVYADGSKYVRTTERLERNGKTKVTTTEQRFDPAGNLTSESREASSTRAWSGSIPGAGASFSWSWNSDTGTRRKNSDENGRESRDGDDDDEAGWGDGKDEKKGWFWNR